MTWYNSDDYEGYYGPSNRSKVPRKEYPMYDVIVDVLRQDRSAHEYRESRACDTKEDIAAFLSEVSSRMPEASFESDVTEGEEETEVSDEDQDVIDNL